VVMQMTEHEKDLERIRNFRLMDDDFMTACFAENIECTELVLQIILNRKDLKVIQSHAQYSIKNLLKRSVRLDILAIDADGNRHNIEIQRSEKGANPRRARYNGSLIDASISHSGEDYDQLPDVYVIFITEEDVFKLNRPLYRFERMTTEDNFCLDDGSHIIYVNGAYQDDSPLGRLMMDFNCTEPAQMHYSVLKERTRYFKENEEGVGSMCRAIEEMRQSTLKERNIEIALQMLADHMPIELIAKYSTLTVEELTELANQNSN
jgi:hypothetical protein